MTDCEKEAYAGRKSGGVSQQEGRGGSASGSMSEEPSEETSLLPTAPRDDDCLAAVAEFPREAIKHVDNVGEGIFGEVSLFFVLCRGNENLRTRYLRWKMTG